MPTDHLSRTQHELALVWIGAAGALLLSASSTSCSGAQARPGAPPTRESESPEAPSQPEGAVATEERETDGPAYDPDAPEVLLALAEAYVAFTDAGPCTAAEVTFDSEDPGGCDVRVEARLGSRAPFQDVAFLDRYTGGTCGCWTSDLLVNTGDRWVQPVRARPGAVAAPFLLDGPCDNGGTQACMFMDSEPRSLRPFLVEDAGGPVLAVEVGGEEARFHPEFPPLPGPDDGCWVRVSRLYLFFGCEAGVCAEVELVTSVVAGQSIVDAACLRELEDEGYPGDYAYAECDRGRSLVDWSLEVEPSPSSDAIVLTAGSRESRGRPPRDLPGSHTISELRQIAARLGDAQVVQQAIDDSPAETAATATAEDSALIEGGDPALLGDRCFAELRERRYDRARRLCLAALDVARDPATEGAILYNLGRIAESRSARSLAGRYYRRSLAVRPGNQVVQDRLDRLSPGDG